MEQDQSVTPEQPIEQFSIADSLKRTMEREAGEDWHPPATEPTTEPEGETPEAAAEPDQAPPEPEPEGQPQLAEVEIDGKTYQVPPELKDGYLRQSDYTKKTQQTAAERQSVLEMKAAAEQAFAVVSQLTPLIGEWHNAQQMAERYNKVDWNALYESDPLGHNKAKLDAQENWQKLQWLNGQLQQAPQALQTLQQRALIEETQRNLPKAVELVPDLDKRRGELIETGKGYGFTDAELGGVTDPRHVKILADLSEYKKLTANKAQVLQKVQQASPVAKPGSRAAAPAVSAKDYQASLRKLRTDRDSGGDAFVQALRTQRKLQGQ